MKTIRLMGHAGSDIEIGYNSKKNIENNEFNDPLLHSSRILIHNKCLSKDEILNLYENTREIVNHVCEEASIRPKLNTSKSVKQSILSNSRQYILPRSPRRVDREKVFGKEYQRIDQPQHMAKLINYALTDILTQYSNTLVFGEDVAEKGGVYNVTANLFEQFGIRRVFNSPLDETSIIGTAIGLSHNGFIPIPEIQFLAYYHNAEDQLRGEAATLPFFSKGQFVNPMVLRIPGLAYQKGFGGHFHNDNSLTIFRDIPGLILAVPSNGIDASKMLRTAVREAYENGRITVFVEPIALYMKKDLYKPKDGKWNFRYPDVKEEIVGSAEVQEIFKVSKIGKVAGSKVVDGEIANNLNARLIRDGNVLYTGSIGSIFREKNAAKQVAAGLECGITLKDFTDFKEKDVIEVYKIIETKRKI